MFSVSYATTGIPPLAPSPSSLPFLFTAHATTDEILAAWKNPASVPKVATPAERAFVNRHTMCSAVPFGRKWRHVGKNVGSCG
jgi:hypothetical protein